MEAKSVSSNNRTAKKILKWKPKYIGKKGFKEGLRIMLDWVKDQKNNKVNLFND